MDTLVKHLPGQHDQSEHGRWADGRTKPEGTLAPTADVDSLYAQAYHRVLETDPADLSKEDLEYIDPQEAAPYLKQGVSAGVADRVETTPEELWSLASMERGDEGRSWEDANADLWSARAFGSLLPVAMRDPSLVPSGRFTGEVQRLRELSALSDGQLYDNDRTRARLEDGSWVLEEYGPALERFGVDLGPMSIEQRGIHVAALDISVESRAITPEAMAQAIADGTTLSVNRRDGTSHLGLPEWTRNYRAMGDPSDPDVVRAGVEYVSEQVVNAWAASSNWKASILTQEAAALEFGLDKTAEARSVKSLVSPQEMSLVRKVVRAQYEATQELLDRHLPDATHVTLFRGGDSAKRYENPSDLVQRTVADEARRVAAGVVVPGVREGFYGSPPPVVTATLNLRPLASFSTDPGEAKAFAAGADTSMFVAAVPKERILSTAVTGVGSASEYEFVVLGGPIFGVASLGEMARVQTFADIMSDHVIAQPFPSSPYHAASTYPDWDLPMGATEFVMIDGRPVPIGKRFVKHLAGQHDQREHGNWALRAKSQWGEGISDDAAVHEIDSDGVRALYELAVPRLESDEIRFMSEEDKGRLKDSVASGLVERLTDELTAGELIAGLGPYGPHKRISLNRERQPLEEGDTAWVQRTSSGEVLIVDEAGRDDLIAGNPALRDGFTEVTIGDELSREMLAYRFANESLQAWANSSQSIGGRNMQRAVSETFDLGVDVPNVPDASWAREGAAYKALVSAMYEDTQRALNEQFPDTDYIRLYRGGDDLSRYTVDGDAAKGGTATIALRPLASFSTDADTTMAFAGNPTDDGVGVYDGFTALVPKSRIFATPATGIGAADEFEFVVIGGDIRGVPVRSNMRGHLPSAMMFQEFVSIDGNPIPVGTAPV